MTEFQPTQFADYTRSLEESFQFSNQGDARNQQAMRVRQEVDQRTAGQTMKQLSEISSTAANIVKGFAEKRVENQRAEGELWRLQHENDPKVQQEIAEVTQDVADIDKEAVAINETVQKLKQENENIFITDGFKRLSPQAKIGAKIAHIQLAASEFQLTKDDFKAAMDNGDFNGIMRPKLLDFYKQLNKGGHIRSGLIAKYANPVIKEKKSEAYKTWYSDRKAEMIAEENEAIYKPLDAAMIANNTSEVWRLIGANKEYFGNYRKSRIATLLRLNTLVKKGIVKDDFVTKFGNLEISIDGVTPKLGNKVKFKEAFKIDYADLQTSVTEFRKQEYNAKESERKIKVQTFKGKVREAILNAPPGATKDDDFWEPFIEEFKRDHPLESVDWLTSKRDKTSATTVADDKVSKWIEKGIKTRTITIDQLYDANVSPSLINKYKGEINIIESQKVKREHYKKLSETAVKAGAKNTIFPDTSIAEMSETVFTRVEQLAWELAVLDKNPDGTRDYWAEAWEKVNTHFEKNRNEFVKRRGYKDITPDQLAPSSPEWKDAIKDLNEKLGSIPRDKAMHLPIQTEEGAQLETAFYTQSGLEAETQGYGDYGWEPSPKLEYLADFYGVTPRDFLSNQRVAIGLTPLGETQEEIHFNKLNGRDKNILNRNKKEILNAETATMWGAQKVEQKDGTFREYLVPLNKGKEIKDEAEKQKVDGASCAAVYDLLQNVDEFGQIDGWEDIKNDPYTFNKFQQCRYKYETDSKKKQDALNNTATRFDLNNFLLNIK